MTTRSTTTTQDSALSEPGRRHVVSEFERLLREPGCPACRYLDEAERSYFSWLRIESFSVAAVQAKLRAGMGMCAPHSRRLVEEFGEGHVMTIVAREAIDGARRRVRDEAEPGPCAACGAVGFGSRRARRLVIDGLSDPAALRLYSEHEGLCLPHFIAAVQVLDAPALALLAERLLRSLQEGDDALMLPLLAGTDRDVTRRASWRARLPEVAASESTVEGLCDRLQIDACPVCLSAGLTERGYLDWLLEHTRQRDPSLDSDPGELCAGHLHDLALAVRSEAAKAIEHKRGARLAQVRRMLANLAELPAPGRRNKRANVELDAAREPFTTTPYCPACNARDGIEQAQLELVTAALALPGVRDLYERSHGLCATHALRVPDGQAARLARRHVDARLGMLAWEVHETARKYAWAFRHEAKGPEQDAWLRALAQIDGRVFEGGPAPAAVPVAVATDGPDQP